MTMPSDNRRRPSLFDRFADRAAAFTSKAWFFAACVLLVVVWAPSYFATGSVDTWQLLINTPTTIVTFLLVGLSQNTQSRRDNALQEKVNAIAKYLADGDRADAAELRAAVGLEDQEAS